MRREKNVPHSKKITLYVETENTNYENILNDSADIIIKLAGIKNISVDKKFDISQL